MTSRKTILLTVGITIIVVTGATLGIYFGVFYTPDNSGDNGDGDTVDLVVIGTETSKNFTVAEVKALTSFTGYGGYKNQVGNIGGYALYKGVSMLTLLDEVGGLPVGFAIRVTASDNYKQTYLYSTINGNVTTYDNTTGDDLGYSILTMALIYEEVGVGSISDGPFRVGFLSEEGGYVTDSALWAKFTIKIEALAA